MNPVRFASMFSTTVFAALLFSGCQTASVPLAPINAQYDPLTSAVAAAVVGEAVKPRGQYSLGRRLLLWPVNRTFDMLDVGFADVSIGPGFSVHAHPTSLAQVGIGSFAGLRVGWIGRKFPISFQMKSEVGASLLYLESSDNRGFFSASVMFHFVMVGMETGVDLFEVVDLVTGIVLVDISNDDF